MRVERGEVAVERAAGLGGVEQTAEAAAGRPAVRGRRAGPRGRDAGDDRVRRAGGELVDEADVDRAVGLGVDRHLPELRQLVEQLVAAVEKVVRHVAGGDEALDHVVELGDLVRDLGDLAAGIAGAGGAREVGVLRVGLGLRELDLRPDGLERVGQARGLLDERLLGGRLVAGGGREDRPGVPELRELLVDAVLARLGEPELGAIEGTGARGPLAEVRVLRAVLEVDELVADAAEALDVDAGAEVGAGAAGDAARGDLQRGGRDERGLLAGVALGRRVGDVVTGRVEQPLLGEEPAERRLEAVEGGDRHDLRLQVQDAVERRERRGRPAPSGRP